MVRLGEVLRPVARGEAVDAAKEYRLLGVRLDGQGAFLREVVTGTQTSAKRLFRVAQGDFIYSRLFACRGAFGVIGKDLDGCHVSGEFPTFVPSPGKVDVEFLRYWFRLPTVIGTVNEDCSGSTPLTRNRFKEQFFLALEIPLPPLSEQRRVVARIEALAAELQHARELRKQAAEEAEALITATHVQLAGPRRRKLGAVLELHEEVVPVSAAGTYPQVGVRGFGGGLFTKAAVGGTETTYRNFNRLYEGAVVLSQVKGWEGAVAVCPASLSGWFASPEYRTFRCIPDQALPNYFAALVRTEWFWRKLAGATRGVGARRERTRPEQFLAVECPMPDVEQQAHGARLCAQVGSLTALQAASAAELDALLPAVLDRAFKGDL